MNGRARTILHEYCGQLDNEGFIIRAMEVYAAEVCGHRPCFFFTPEAIENYEHEDENGFLSFDRAWRGVWEMWGVAEGQTVGIVRDGKGNVWVVQPSFIQFTS
jgi:hypothetical protein